MQALPAPHVSKVDLTSPLDLEATLYSGQAFRWTRAGEGIHVGFIQNQPCKVWADENALWYEADGMSAATVARYFRLDGDHEAFLGAVPKDAALAEALLRFPGLRLLRQDPWEMLVSFIISQNSNEAKIRKTIEALCRLASSATEHEGVVTHRFPTPAELARLDTAQLRTTGMGYRARYVHGVAEAAAIGNLEPDRLAALPYQHAFERLMQVDGIGAKVADCVLLYGCDHQQAFPSDVWVRRFLRETYMRRTRAPSHDKIRAFAWRHFGPRAGYAQHYLFHYRRSIGALAASRS